MVDCRVVVPGSFSWQSTENTAEPPPGSAMAVAKHIFSSLLTQFGDRRLFLFLFGTDYGDNTQAVFSALGHGLEGNEGEGPVEGTDGESEGKLSEITIVKYFLQVKIISTYCDSVFIFSPFMIVVIVMSMYSMC